MAGLGEMLQGLVQQGGFTPPSGAIRMNPGEEMPPPMDPTQLGPEQLVQMLAGAQGGGEIPPEIMAIVQALVDAEGGMGPMPGGPQPNAFPEPSPPAAAGARLIDTMRNKELLEEVNRY